MVWVYFSLTGTIFHSFPHLLSKFGTPFNQQLLGDYQRSQNFLKAGKKSYAAQSRWAEPAAMHPDEQVGRESGQDERAAQAMSDLSLYLPVIL